MPQEAQQWLLMTTLAFWARARRSRTTSTNRGSSYTWRASKAGLMEAASKLRLQWGLALWIKSISLKRCIQTSTKSSHRILNSSRQSRHQRLISVTIPTTWSPLKSVSQRVPYQTLCLLGRRSRGKIRPPSLQLSFAATVSAAMFRTQGQRLQTSTRSTSGLWLIITVLSLRSLASGRPNWTTAEVPLCASKTHLWSRVECNHLIVPVQAALKLNLNGISEI